MKMESFRDEGARYDRDAHSLLVDTVERSTGGLAGSLLRKYKLENVDAMRKILDDEEKTLRAEGRSDDEIVEAFKRKMRALGAEEKLF